MKKMRFLVLMGFVMIMFSQAVQGQEYQFYAQDDVPAGYDYPSSYSQYYDQDSYPSFSVPNYYNYGSSSRPRFTSNYDSSVSYKESPGYSQGPKAMLIQNQSNSASSSNQDSASYNYDYRGPLYERKFIQVDDFTHDLSGKSGFFYTRNNNLLKHLVTTTMTEKYVGASESVNSNSQNRQFSSSNSNQDTAQSYDGGFSFGKQRSYDSSEFATESYKEPYYYRPYYNSDAGYYSWNY